MASALIGSAIQSLCVGSVSYAICRGSNQSNPFEKAVLVTVMVGFRILADNAIKHQMKDEQQRQALTRVLIASTSLLAIPFTLYVGRVFDFKAVDYLKIVGLTSVGYSITSALSNLSAILTSKGSK